MNLYFIMKSSDITNMKKVVFVLKKAPGGVVYDNYNNYGPGHYDPMWSICRGYKTCKHIRFTGYIGKMGWMEVICLDLTTELRGKHMVWKVSNDCQEIRCFDYDRISRITQIRCFDYDRIGGRNGRSNIPIDDIDAIVGGLDVTQKQINDNINVIRLRLYWVLRGIVGFKRLLARVRLRHKRRKIFIQATYWGHPKCTLSCFSGTINTPVKQRIHAFI